jgi:hypothetical protein
MIKAQSPQQLVNYFGAVMRGIVGLCGLEHFTRQGRVHQTLAAHVERNLCVLGARGVGVRSYGQ